MHAGEAPDPSTRKMHFRVFWVKEIPLRIFIMATVWNLPPAADKKMAEISKKISSQKVIIERAEAVSESKGDTYICGRARVTLASLKLKIEIIDHKRKEFETLMDMKEKEVLEKIEAQEKIIWDETHKESGTVIAARKEIEILESQKRDILKACGINIPLPSLTPAPEREEEPEDVVVTVADFFRETRLDGTPITNSHLDGPFKYVETSLPGVGSLPKRKTVYGRVSDLEKAAREARAANKS